MFALRACNQAQQAAEKANKTIDSVTGSTDKSENECKMDDAEAKENVDSEDNGTIKD